MANTSFPKAILFGSIGTLIETSEMQRAAFNKAFDEAGLDWHWDAQSYRDTLASSGGLARIETYAQSRSETVDAVWVHQLKTHYFTQALKSSNATPRAGVLDVMKYAYDKGIDLAFVTSTSRANVDGVFTALGNTIAENDFKFVGDASMVSTNKPSPDIYFEALKRLGYKAPEVVTIEDSEPSMIAAVDAGIPCIAFPGENTTHHNYAKASSVLTHLTPEAIKEIEPVPLSPELA
ncbi:MAG: HAD-IA family hydrolase [Pseudomonadota bacterium]